MHKPIDILLIEDNDGDVRLIQEALKERKVFNKIYVTRDGEEATLFLKREGKYQDVPHPDLILLDLNLPKKDGREVLKEIKEDKNLRRIPVIVLSTSRAEEDILKTYDLHVNCFISKPVDFNEFLRVIKHIEDFWLCIVHLPGKE